MIVYVSVPDGIIATGFPEQMVASFTVNVGVIFTDTVDTIVFPDAQPLVPVPVTEYEVVVEGATV